MKASKVKKLILTIAVAIAAGVFFNLVFTGSVSAADWVETFDTDVLASGEWVTADFPNNNAIWFPQGSPFDNWNYQFGNTALVLWADWNANSIAYYKNGTAWTDYSVVVPNFGFEDVDSGRVTNQGVGITFRVRDKDNFYYIGFDNTHNTVILGKRIGGVFNPLTNAPFPIGELQIQKVKVDVFGNNIKVYINDELKIDYNDLTSSFLSGSVGAFSDVEYMRSAGWDEFQVGPFYTISGHAWDKNNNPVVGATITIESPALVAPIVLPPTDENGYYETEPLSRGTYNVTGSHPSYSFVPQEVTIVNSDVDVSFYTISGYVTRYGGEGINGVNVTISGGDYQPGFSATLPTINDGSGNPGYYEKQGMGNGTYTIEAENPPAP